MKTGSQVFEKTIGPGAIASIEQEGDFFLLLRCGIEVQIKIAGGSFMPYTENTGEDYARVGKFNRIEIKNPTLAEVVIQIYVGASRYISNRSSVMETATEIIGQPVTSIAALGSVALPGTASGSLIRRKSIVVSNMDLANSLLIVDGDGNYCAAVFPETSITLPISGPVEIRNDTAGLIVCYISEVFYSTTA